MEDLNKNHLKMSNKPKTIFIFAYYSFKDPVFQSAVLPYFTDFPEKEQFQFVLLNFEQRQYKTTTEDRNTIRLKLASHNILWYTTTWHSGRFKLIKKAFDFLWGIAFSMFLIIRYKAEIIYSEGFPGAIIAHFIAKLSFRKHIVHTFEPHADYMVEAGVWTNHSWETRLIRKLEIIVAKNCSAVMTATDAMVRKLTLELGTSEKLHRVPSCVDLITFNFHEDSRKQLRTKHGLEDHDILIAYMGKLDGMYMNEEIFRFFSICQNSSKRYHFWIITPEDHAPIEQSFEKAGIPKDNYLIKTLSRNEIAAYLSASDLGFVAIRQYASNIYRSPIKDGEYWACGLPVIIPKGISDDWIFAKENNLGIILDDTSDISFEKTLSEIDKWFAQEDKELIRQRCRSFVEEDRSVEVYKMLYKNLFLRL